MVLGRNFVPEVADAGDLDARRKREALEREKEEEIKKCPALQQKLPRNVVVPTTVDMITRSDDVLIYGLLYWRGRDLYTVVKMTFSNLGCEEMTILITNNNVAIGL